MTQIDEASIVIERDPAAVLAFAADPIHDPQWHTTVAEVRRTSTGPFGPGATYAGQYDPGRRTLDMPPDPRRFQALRATLVEYEPGIRSRLHVAFVEPPRGVGARILGRAFDLTFRVESVVGGTRLHRGGAIHPTALAIPIVWLFGRFNAGRSDYLLGLLKVAAERAIPGG